jgi:hypothetical protein
MAMPQAIVIRCEAIVIGYELGPRLDELGVPYLSSVQKVRPYKSACADQFSGIC